MAETLTYAQHPLSAAFPRMSSDEYQTLRDSIESIGVQSPIVIFEGMVLDGWHRYSAANDLRMRCPVVTLGDVDPVDFVRAANKARRHMSAGQWALVEVQLSEWHPSGQVNSKVAAAATFGKTNAQMAESAGVSERTIRSAKAVATNATPEVKAAVQAGDLSVERAAEISKLPAKKQAKAMKTPAPPKAKKSAPASEVEQELEPDRVHELEAKVAELSRNLAETLADNESMGKVFDANDQLKTALAENKQLRAEVASLKERLRGLQSEKNEAVRAAKSWQRKAGAVA